MQTLERTYQAFYTRSEPIVEYMLEMLSPQPGEIILEPCAGDGIFIDAILNVSPGCTVDAFEINPESIHKLHQKFSHHSNVSIKQSDTLLDTGLSLKITFGGGYDKIIANPPYGAWQDYEKRKILKKTFPSIYVKESYSLFLFQSVELLKEHGRLVFIIPDTFLNLHLHKGLRKYLLKRTRIQEILLFPSSFFPGVNFGYANLCILTLEKNSSEERCLENSFPVMSGFANVEDLPKRNILNVKRNTFIQNTILNNVDHAFFIHGAENVSRLVNSHSKRIGDIAKCVTGFYSGDDKTYLRAASKELRNGKGYELVDRDLIALDYSHKENILDGIDDERCYLPILKGGNTKYIKSDSWYMNWSIAAVKEYKASDKARFQNSQYYFKYGVGVPMVSSTQITGALIENKLFDQSIVGIFPHDLSLTYFLLAFFNSPTCNKLIRAINPSANNPANYIKKIPFVEPGTTIIKQTYDLVQTILFQIRDSGLYNLEIEKELHGIIEELYHF